MRFTSFNVLSFIELLNDSQDLAHPSSIHSDLTHFVDLIFGIYKDHEYR